MKIAYCLSDITAGGGMERVLVNKANYLVRHGHEVHVLSARSGGGRPPFFPLDPRVRLCSLDCDDVYRKGITRALARRRGRRRLLQRLSEELGRIRPDVAVSLFDDGSRQLHAVDDGSAKILELHFAKYKRSQYLYPLERHRWLRPLIDLYKAADYRTLRRYDRFVVLTEDSRQAWQRPGLDHIVVIPNAQSFPCTEPAALDAPRVIALGRHTTQKQFDLLLRAWGKIAARHPGWRLAIVGGGDKRDLAALAGDLGIAAGVDLEDATRDVRGELMRSSVLVLTSRYEGLPMVLIEAMTCGLPVVSFDCRSGPADIVRHGEDGYLVPAGDIDAFATRLDALLTDATLRKAMGAAAFRNVRRFDEDTVMRQWLALFEDAVAERNRRR
jgi:glycosyltransferase involved in cell wall biosynthesis